MVVSSRVHWWKKPTPSEPSNIRTSVRQCYCVVDHFVDRNLVFSLCSEGSYAFALSGGTTIKGFKDFTRGAAEMYELKKAPEIFIASSAKLWREDHCWAALLTSVVHTPSPQTKIKLKLSNGFAYWVFRLAVPLTWRWSPLRSLLRAMPTLW